MHRTPFVSERSFKAVPQSNLAVCGPSNPPQTTGEIADALHAVLKLTNWARRSVGQPTRREISRRARRQPAAPASAIARRGSAQRLLRPVAARSRSNRHLLSWPRWQSPVCLHIQQRQPPYTGGFFHLLLSRRSCSSARVRHAASMRRNAILSSSVSARLARKAQSAALSRKASANLIPARWHGSGMVQQISTVKYL